MKQFSFLFLFLTTYFVFANTNNILQQKPFVVVLDAGHGGHDPGNRGNGLYEKTIALDIILKTGAILGRNPNIKVVYTRKTDVFIELKERGDIANRAKADLFVSVHCNAHKGNAFGTETFVLGLHANERNFNIAKKENSVILLEDNYESNYEGFNPNSAESVIGLTLMQEEYLEQSLSLASFVQNNFSTQLSRKNRGVKQAGFYVLHRTFMPSVLIETGFLTNKGEGSYLNSNKGKQQMAQSISKAILDYKKSVSDSFATEPAKVIVKPNKIKSTIIKSPNTKIISKDGKAISIAKKTEEKGVDTGVKFRVQLAASQKRIDPVARNFKGIENVEMLKIGKYYKYYLGITSNYKKALKLRREAVSHGFKTSFIVPFKNNNPVKLTPDLKKY